MSHSGKKKKKNYFLSNDPSSNIKSQHEAVRSFLQVPINITWTLQTHPPVSHYKKPHATHNKPNQKNHATYFLEASSIFNGRYHIHLQASFGEHEAGPTRKILPSLSLFLIAKWRETT